MLPIIFSIAEKEQFKNEGIARLMEKMGRISSGCCTSDTQGAIKKLLVEDLEQIKIFFAHSMCEAAAAIAAPLSSVSEK